MKRRRSILWIIFLLGALFAGPAVFLEQNRLPASLQPLRLAVDSEDLIDAPRALSPGELSAAENAP